MQQVVIQREAGAPGSRRTARSVDRHAAELGVRSVACSGGQALGLSHAGQPRDQGDGRHCPTKACTRLCSFVCSVTLTATPATRWHAAIPMMQSKQLEGCLAGASDGGSNWKRAGPP